MYTHIYQCSTPEDSALTKMILDSERVQYQRSSLQDQFGGYHERFHVESLDPNMSAKKGKLLQDIQAGQHTAQYKYEISQVEKFFK